MYWKGILYRSVILCNFYTTPLPQYVGTHGSVGPFGAAMPKDSVSPSFISKSILIYFCEEFKYNLRFLHR